MSHNTDSFGTGALRSPPDPRDFNLSFIAGAPAPVEWRPEPLGRPQPPDTNQRSSDCCVGEAWSNAHWIVKGKPFSVRSIFAYIALPYGAYGRDGGNRIVSKGQETYQEAPDPDPKTAQNMRSKVGLHENLGLDDTEDRFFAIQNPHNIDQVAQAIRDWRNCPFRVELSAEGWQDKTNPRPPVFGEDTEGHYICGFDYHLHNGLKCIIAKSSWCSSSHHVHHIREDYYESWNTSDAYVLVPKENLPMVERYRVNYHGTLGVALRVAGAFGIEVYLAKNDAMYQNLLKDYEVPVDASFLFNIPA